MVASHHTETVLRVVKYGDVARDGLLPGDERVAVVVKGGVEKTVGVSGGNMGSVEDGMKGRECCEQQIL